ncbi:hypothetical protein SAE02_55530 [Skermanella aerolata]|uniref:Uncharacterized protein n=1 Tax=Skermanella aerolata TaxID=393310 RepID=A0A512DY61_9PROT|nr:hypothetical protein [Skermanella aerolata]KJB93272.1 hypothetical protein N826_17835 [Skermanella aerolata KACC 11604]GEO41405.1 hypothetical protein SAE02_55530 [Skermanella aerolata]
MTTWAELQQLSSAIAQASDDKLIQIVRIVDTLPERTQLDEAISKVRHRLFWLRPPRPLSVARILFAPVEDLLDGPLSYRRGSKRFNRAIIRPVTEIFESAMGEAKSVAIRAELMGKTTKHRDFALAFGERLWPAASDILADFAKRAATDQRLRTERIGRDEDVLHQIADMAAFLRFGARIEQIKADLPPKPFEDLQPHHVQMIEEVFITLPLPEDVALFTRILLALSGEPAKVLELLERVKIQATQRQRDALVGDLTQSVIDKLGEDADRLVDIPRTDLQVAAKVAGRLVSSLDALGRKRQWGSINVDARTLDRTRRAIGDFVVENLNRTAEDSAVSMAATKANPAPATDAQAVEAEERAGALRQFRDLARSLKIDHHTKARFDTITRSMDQEALEQVRSAVAQGLSRAEIDQIIVDRLRICDIVEGYERTKELRSKLMSAAART